MSNSSLENAYAYAAALQMKADQPPLPRHVRRRELQQIVPLANTTIYEMEHRGEFPKRFYLTPRCPVWALAEIEAWIEERRIETKAGPKPNAPDVRRRKKRPVRG